MERGEEKSKRQSLLCLLPSKLKLTGGHKYTDRRTVLPYCDRQVSGLWRRLTLKALGRFWLSRESSWWVKEYYQYWKSKCPVVVVTQYLVLARREL